MQICRHLDRNGAAIRTHINTLTKKPNPKRRKASGCMIKSSTQSFAVKPFEDQTKLPLPLAAVGCDSCCDKINVAPSHLVQAFAIESSFLF